MSEITNNKTHITILFEFCPYRFRHLNTYTGQSRELVRIETYQRSSSHCALIHLIIYTCRYQRHHGLSRVNSLSELRRSPIETCSKMPALIVLEREHIYQHLEIIDSRLTDHFYMIIYVKASKTIQKFFELIKTCLLTVAILIITPCGLTINGHIKPQ